MKYAALFMRLALGVSFLSAVADRFGLWGAYGKPHVAWGDFSRFTAYTGTLLWFLPQTFYPLIAWTATAAELVFGIALIIGFRRYCQTIPLHICQVFCQRPVPRIHPLSNVPHILSAP